MSAARRYITFIVAAGLVLLAGYAVAALTEAWTYIFPETGSFQGMAVASDGSIFWAGSQDDEELLQRFGADADLVYSKPIRQDATPWTVALSPDEATLVVAGEWWPGPGHFPVPWVARHDAADGKRDWEVMFDALEFAAVSAVAISADGQSIYVTGSQFSLGATPAAVFVARLTLDGDVLWQSVHESATDVQAWAVAVDPKKEQRVCIGGYDGLGERKALLLCLDAEDGTELWRDVAAGNPFWAGITALAMSSNGKKIFVVGYTDFDQHLEMRSWFFQQFNAKNGKGKRRVVHDVTPLGLESPLAMVQSSTGIFYVAGDGCRGIDSAAGCDAYLLALNGRGRRQDIAMYALPGARDTEGSAVGLDADGNPIWGGIGEFGSLPDSTPWIRKMTN